MHTDAHHTEDKALDDVQWATAALAFAYSLYWIGRPAMAEPVLDAALAWAAVAVRFDMTDAARWLWRRVTRATVTTGRRVRIAVTRLWRSR